MPTLEEVLQRLAEELARQASGATSRGGATSSGDMTDLLRQDEVIYLYKFIADWSEAVLTNPQVAGFVLTLGETVVWRCVSLNESGRDVILEKWKWLRLWVPLQVRLFMEQAFWIAGGPWRRAVSGFRPMSNARGGSWGGGGAPSPQETERGAPSPEQEERAEGRSGFRGRWRP